MVVSQKPKLYTVLQVAEYLNVSPGTVYTLIGRGALRSIKVGRKRRVTETALIEFTNDTRRVQDEA